MGRASLVLALLSLSLAGCERGAAGNADRAQAAVDARARAAGEADASQIIKDARIDALEAQVAELGNQLAAVKADVETTPPPAVPASEAPQDVSSPDEAPLRTAGGDRAAPDRRFTVPVPGSGPPGASPRPPKSKAGTALNESALNQLENP